MTAHSPQTTTILNPIPMGMAVMHHCKASRRTKRNTWRRVAPKQRSKPKNSMRWLTLLFKLLEIIITQVPITTKESRNAIVYICDILEPGSCPSILSSSSFWVICASDMPFCCWISAMLELTLVSSENRTTYCQLPLRSAVWMLDSPSGVKRTALALPEIILAASSSIIPVIASCIVLPSGEFKVRVSPNEIPAVCANVDETATCPAISGNSPERTEPK